MRSRTVAVRRTEPQGPNPGLCRRAPEPVLSRFGRVRPAAPRASDRRCCPAPALGRWRCRWSTPLPLAVAGIGPPASRCPTSPDAWSSVHCSLVPGVREAAPPPATVGWRRAPTRSSATCSGSSARPSHEPGSSALRVRSPDCRRGGGARHFASIRCASSVSVSPRASVTCNTVVHAGFAWPRSIRASAVTVRPAACATASCVRRCSSRAARRTAASLRSAGDWGGILRAGS